MRVGGGTVAERVCVGSGCFYFVCRQKGYHHQAAGSSGGRQAGRQAEKGTKKGASKGAKLKERNRKCEAERAKLRVRSRAKAELIHETVQERCPVSALEPATPTHRHKDRQPRKKDNQPARRYCSRCLDDCSGLALSATWSGWRRLPWQPPTLLPVLLLLLLLVLRLLLPLLLLLLLLLVPSLQVSRLAPLLQTTSATQWATCWTIRRRTSDCYSTARGRSRAPGNTCLEYSWPRSWAVL